MTRHRFQNILESLTFAPPTEANNDPWYPIRIIVNGFNERRKKVIFPGKILCIDECMSAWRGREDKYTHDGIPHKTKIARKPEGVGAEMKSIADGDSGIILGFDIMEGKSRQSQKMYHAQFGEGTAVVLRLSAPYAGSGRTVVADSAFASVKTLVQLKEHFGLFFMGMVKTACKQYPKEKYLSWLSSGNVRRGDFIIFQSELADKSLMYALCWSDRKGKMIISNRGTTLPGNDSVRTRHKKIERNGVYETVRYSKRIPRPQMVELFFSKFSTIDIHNHYRQGSLKMEKQWQTQSWYLRIFTTIFGTIVVDAYLAYRYEKTQQGSYVAGEIIDFFTFTARMAHELIFNEYLTQREARNNDLDSEDESEQV
jgi:hypothetical protein